MFSARACGSLLRAGGLPCLFLGFGCLYAPLPLPLPLPLSLLGHIFPGIKGTTFNTLFGHTDFPSAGGKSLLTIRALSLNGVRVFSPPPPGREKSTKIMTRGVKKSASRVCSPRHNMTPMHVKQHPSRAKTMFSRTHRRRSGPRRLGRRCSSNGGRLQAGIQKRQTGVPSDSKCGLWGFAFAVAFTSGLCTSLPPGVKSPPKSRPAGWNKRHPRCARCATI